MDNRYRIAVAMLVAGALSACDNMSWGGASLALVRPEPKNPVVDEEPGDSAEVLPPLPEGPSVFVVEQTEQGARIMPVAEVAPGGLAPHPDETEASGARARFVEMRMPPGSVFHVFADGLRVGRFVAAAGMTVDSTTCQERPSVTGILEVIPAAAQVQTFLALPDSVGAGLTRGTYEPPESGRGLRFQSRRIFGEEIPRLGARYPSDIERSRGELRLLSIPAADGAAMSSTYLFRDRLDTGPPSRSGAYAMMMLAEPGPDGYERRFTWYRRADVDGKGAPQVVDHMDWDGDGDSELLLRVHGESTQWFAALDREGSTGWELSFEDACRPRPPEQEPEND